MSHLSASSRLDLTPVDAVVPTQLSRCSHAQQSDKALRTWADVRCGEIKRRLKLLIATADFGKGSQPMKASSVRPRLRIDVARANQKATLYPADPFAISSDKMAFKFFLLLDKPLGLGRGDEK